VHVYTCTHIYVEINQAKRPDRRALDTTTLPDIAGTASDGTEINALSPTRSLPAKRAFLRDLLNPRTMELYADADDQHG